MKKKVAALLVFSVLFVSGCAKIPVSPSLNSSLGYVAFKNMQSIEARDVSLALYFEPELLQATSQQSVEWGEFTFKLGSALAVKVIKGLSYQFRTIHIIDQPQVPDGMDAQALMRVSLQDFDSQMDVKTGWSSVAAESYTRLSIRAEIKDFAENRVVWVGASQVSQEGGIEEMMLTYQEAGRGFAAGFDSAIDKAVGDLLNQINKSSNLDKYFDRWETAEKS